MEQLIRLNKALIFLAGKFEDLIEERLKLSRNLSQRQQRHAGESMASEELLIFDILTRPDDNAKVKNVARALLNRLKYWF